MKEKVIIIGGSTAGISAAVRLRRLNENIDILVFEKSKYISFPNCALPYYIDKTINNKEDLELQSISEISQKFNIDIRNLSEVIEINKDEKNILIKDLKTKEVYKENYNSLILSTGTIPFIPNIIGINECCNVFTLKNLNDAEKIKSFIDDNNPKNAIIIGAGFTSLEMAESLNNLKISVTIVESKNQVLPSSIDYEMAAIIHKHLIEKNINLIFNNRVVEIKDNGKTITLSSGKTISSDLIILSAGITPNSDFAKESGIKVNDNKTIMVDKELKTSIDDIYAIGDVIESTNFISKEKKYIPSAWSASCEGRLVADVIMKNQNKSLESLGSSIIKVFDLTVAFTGNSETYLKSLNVPYESVHIYPNSHASYYPKSSPISFKLIFNIETGTILGAQAIGSENVDKYIDIIGTAIIGNLTVHDLANLEICYSPPYSSVKDPINIAGNVASNILDGYVSIYKYDEIDKLIEKEAFILDVREEFEFEVDHIEKAVNIPLYTLRDNLYRLPINDTIYVYCEAGVRGYIASRILKENNFKVKNLDGGFKTYKTIKESLNPPKSEIKSTKNNTNNKNLAENNSNKNDNSNKSPNATLDASGLQCPGPIKKVYSEMQKLSDGDILKVLATDPGFPGDIDNWCKKTGNTLLSKNSEKNTYEVEIMKGSNNSSNITNEKDDNISKDDSKNLSTETGNGATLIVFSGELDKAIASFIIATGAASIGKNVTMFFTFWGLNILKKKNKPTINKDKIEKMFDFMLPSHAGKLPLSNMNMAGIGPKMINHIMEKNNVDSLEELISNALEMGVKLVACSMSMDLMGIKKEELIDKVEIAGVASYLGAADDSRLNLFI